PGNSSGYNGNRCKSNRERIIGSSCPFESCCNRRISCRHSKCRARTICICERTASGGCPLLKPVVVICGCCYADLCTCFIFTACAFNDLPAGPCHNRQLIGWNRCSGYLYRNDNVQRVFAVAYGNRYRCITRTATCYRNCSSRQLDGRSEERRVREGSR